MDQETVRILEMVQKGQITPEEAAGLLDTLTPPSESEPTRSQRGRRFRILVTDKRTGRDRVNVSIPMALVEMAAKMGLTLHMKSGARSGVQMGANRSSDRSSDMAGLDVQRIMEAVKSGAEGKIVEADIDDEKGSQHVVVFVE